MKITKFRVQKYRCINDTGWITIEDNLTCIVGKNQSGKTALLKALYKFNPASSEPYDIAREWPRGDRRARDPNQIVVMVEFALESDDIKKIVDIIDTDIVPRRVVYSKDYFGNIEVEFPDIPNALEDKLHPNKVDEIITRFSHPPADTGEFFINTSKDCISDIQRLVKEGRFSDLSKQQSILIERLEHAVSTAPTQQAPNSCRQHIQLYQQTIQQIIEESSKLPTIRKEAHDCLVKFLPTFIYMDEYLEFTGTANLGEIQRRKDKNQLSPEDQTLLMMLELSGLDLTELVKQGNGDVHLVRERQHDLDDAARTLTKEVADRWGQTPYKIQFRADGQTFFAEIEEIEKDVGMIPLEDQSRGFRWFFSFDLRFMHDSGGTFEGCILLLDEPGLHLHPGGQSDLLQRLDAYAEKNILLYSTHLPFLVDLREPNRIWIMTQERNGTSITKTFNKSGPDEKLTLQAAFGMRLNQHYMIAKDNLIVEGIEDSWIITEMSNLFLRIGKPSLPDEIMITAAGGAPEAVYMATFMIGQGLNVVTLFDSDNEGKSNEKKLREKWILRYKDVKSSAILLGAAIGVDQDTAIEDLFDESYYIRMLEKSHTAKMQAAKVGKINLRPGTGLLEKRIDDACSAVNISFNKGSVANLIRKDLAKMKNGNQLGENTISRFEKLFENIREKF